MVADKGRQGSEPASIGFVVIGRNEGSRLADCLRALAGWSDRTVYVDSGSSDGSQDLARRLGATVVELNPALPFTAARGRNEGSRELVRRHPECDLVQFIDGDCILHPDWLPAATEFLAGRPDVAAVCGRRFERSPHESIFNLQCHEEWNTPVGQADAFGGDSLVRIAALIAVGNFNPVMKAGEEPELSARLRQAGWTIFRIDCPMTEHDAKIHSLGQWWKRNERNGFGFAQAWSMTATLPDRPFGRQLRSALFWAALLPAAILLAAVAWHWAAILLLPLLYGVQIVRITARKDILSIQAWKLGALIFFAKFAEALGAVRFGLRGSINPTAYKDQS